MIKYLITGTGRCGTGYAANVLASAGVPCGHEAIFSHGGLAAARRALAEQPGLAAESSWLAAPWLDWLAGQAEVMVVHLVRHPRKVLESLMRVRVLSEDTPYSRFAYRLLRDLQLWKEPQNAAACFYLGWNAIIEPRAHLRHRVESDPHVLLEALGIKHDGPLFDDTTYNTRPEYPPYELDWGTIAPCLWDELAEMAERYGYTL